MGGIGEIILFLVIIGASIAQQVVKSNKKKREEVMRQPSDSTEHESLPEVWRELFSGDPYDFERNDSQKPKTDTQTIIMPHSEEGRSRVSTVTGNRNGYNSSKQTNKKKVQSPALQSFNEITEKDLTEQNEFLKEFDIRKAIIYSEIMTPKFRAEE